MSRRLATLLIAVALAGCTVNVTNPKVDVASKGGIKVDQKATVSATSQMAVEANMQEAPVSAARSKPPYAILDGGVTFLPQEIEIMVSMGLVEKRLAWIMNDNDRFKAEDRARIRAGQLDKAAIQRLLEESMAAYPTPGPSIAPSRAPADPNAPICTPGPDGVIRCPSAAPTAAAGAGT